MTGLRNEVVRRLVLARSLERHGQVACAERNDRFAFARGVMLLHDAVDASLGAIADHLNAALTPKVYLMQYFDLIEEKVEKKKTVPYRTQIGILNDIRVGIKHKGVFPDAEQHAHMPATVAAFLQEVCRDFLAVEYETLSLKALIRSHVVRSYIEKAEEDIGSGDYEDALINLGFAMYHLVESKTVGFLALDGEFNLGRTEFTRPYGTDFTVELLEHGIDPYTYHRFRNLTPRMAYSRKEGEVRYQWDRMFGHAGNWTARNARFCLEFCIDCALKVETMPSYDYDIVYFPSLYEDVIEPVDAEAVIWNVSESIAVRPGYKGPALEPVFTLRKGSSIVGFATDSEDRQEEWQIISNNIPKSERWGSSGFVRKEKVRLTTRPREVSSTEEDGKAGSRSSTSQEPDP